MQLCHEIKPKRTNMANNKRIKRKINYENKSMVKGIKVK